MNIFSKISFWLTFLVLVSFSLEGTPMSFFLTKKDVVLSSPFEGVLTYKGKPLPNVKIERKLSWYYGEEKQDDFVVTDEKGYLNLPIVKKGLKVNHLVHFSISQMIYAKYKGKDILIWATSKSDGPEYSELSGKPINIRCDLALEPWAHYALHSITTRCKWDSIEKLSNSTNSIDALN